MGITCAEQKCEIALICAPYFYSFDFEQLNSIIAKYTTCYIFVTSPFLGNVTCLNKVFQVFSFQSTTMILFLQCSFFNKHFSAYTKPKKV